VATSEAAPPDAPDGSAPPRRFPRWRRVLSWVCIVLSCVLVPLSIIAIWVGNQVNSTSYYVDTVAPLATNSDVQHAVAARVTNTLFDEVDVETVAEDALPPRAAFLAGPLTEALHQFVEEATLRFLQSDEFQTIWDNANRRAHDQVKNALEGGGDVISTEDGKVVLDLSPLVVQLRSELSNRGIGIFDSLPIGQLALRFELFDAEGLERAQDGVKLLDQLRIALPILAVALAAAGIFLGRDRRKALMRWGLGVAVATLVLGFLLSIGRDVYLDALPESVNRSAAGAAFDIVLRFMRTSNRVVFLVGLLIGLGAYLAGSGRVARMLRSRTTSALDTVGDMAAQGDGFDPGGITTFVARFANPLRILGVIVAFVVLIAMDRPDGITVLVILLVLLCYLAVVAIVERIGKRNAAARAARGSPETDDHPANVAQ
jgi:cbb3-type cytochrome oxidase subunit 3